jgi:epoxide hydrolase
VSAIRPFTIAIPPAAVQDLQDRIDRARYPDFRFVDDWSAGTPVIALKELVSYWRKTFDWFAWQDRLNAMEHLRGPIDGEDLHCVRFGGAGANPLPLVILHGWPGSFLEHIVVSERLAKGRGIGMSFEVIVPSLPGYGFSEPPGKPGMHAAEIARRIHLLMRELGYDRYGVQGGDWGSAVAWQLALQFPDEVVGMHRNMGTKPGLSDLSPEEAESLYAQERQKWMAEDGAYYQMQRTRPQTVAYGLVDSPVGLLAWMVEKFWHWTDHGEDMWEVLDKETVLANISLYWLTNTVYSAARLYREQHLAFKNAAPTYVNVPSGVAAFPRDIGAFTPAKVATTSNLVHWTEMPRGGHFAALEQPDLFVDDVGKFFTS